MHDIRAIRETQLLLRPLWRVVGCRMRPRPLKIDGDRRAASLRPKPRRPEQNKACKEVGAAKGRGDEAEFERLRALVAEKMAEVADMNARAKELDEAVDGCAGPSPNLPHDDIPNGADEADNVEIHRWGTRPKSRALRNTMTCPPHAVWI
jgi:seryl-tRNA synthetase